MHGEVLWRHDDDGYGYGAAPITGPACHPPDASYVADDRPDCDDRDDRDDAIYPGAPDACDDQLDSNCDGLDCRPCTEVVVGVLPASAFSGSPTEVWTELERDWASYGYCPVRAIDVIPSNLATLVGSGATVLWAGDPIQYQYSQTWLDAIHQFVEGGHGGLVTTYLIWYSGTDDADLAELVGIDRAGINNNYTSCQIGVDALEPDHPLLHDLPATFMMDYHPYAQRANRPWGQALLPGADLVATSRDGANVLVGYETDTYRGVFVSSMLDYSPPGPDAVRTNYNAAFWASGYDFAP